MTHRIIAALSWLSISILLLSGCTAAAWPPAASISSPVPSANGTAIPVPAASPWETRHPTSNVQNQISNHIPFREGEPMFSDALKAALDRQGNSGTTYDVWIYLYYDICKISGLNYTTYVYEGLTIPQWHDKYIPTIRSLDKYKRQLHSKLINAEPFDKWSGLTEENIKLEAEWDANYEALWEEEHPGKLYPITAYEDAINAYEAAFKAADDAFVASETKRLKSYGITMTRVPNELLFAAWLTKEQVRALPVSENVKGYTVILAYEQDITFDGQSIMYIDQTHLDTGGIMNGRTSTVRLFAILQNVV